MSTASDLLQGTYDTLSQRANLLNPTLAGLQGLSGGANDIYGQAFSRANQGLSPQAMSALNTQATSTIGNDYNNAAQQLNTQLLRRGAAGQGALPSSGGDISRAYQPLYSAMNDAKAKAERDTILADESARNANFTQALGAAGSLYGNINSTYAAGNSALNSAAGVANSLADIEPASLGRILGTTALTSLLGGGVGGNGGNGGLLTGGGTNGTGRFGVVGDALGGLFGGGGGGFNASDAEALSKVAWPEDIAKAVSGVAAPVALEQVGATGITGTLGLGGGSGLLGLGALTIPVIGGVALAIGLLAKKYWGNGPDRMAANQLTGPGGVHDYFVQATDQIKALPEGSPERASAENVRDRAMEQALLGFSKIDKDHYYQAKQTLEQFAQFTSVKPLLG